uniref:Uncharacterized protein n=1 Tax=Steinernema glaseri TaxID=37863 RepID=A0A1I7YUY3_9BILA
MASSSGIVLLVFLAIGATISSALPYYGGYNYYPGNYNHDLNAYRNYEYYMPTPYHPYAAYEANYYEAPVFKNRKNGPPAGVGPKDDGRSKIIVKKPYWPWP